jgi:large subunit ribosomal protein L13
MKTYSPKPEHIERRWYVMDADGQVLGRLASEAAALLRGKHKPIFAPHMDTGDHVIIVNAEKAVLTGGKELKKVAYRHSGYPGGIKGVRYDRLMAEKPAFAVEKAVKGMLPKNRLGRAMAKKLHVVAGPEHPHRAQQPVALAPGERPRWEGLPEPAPLKPRHVKGATSGADAEEASTARDTAEATTAKSPAKQATAKKATAKKATAKKATAKAPTKKATTAKAPAKKATAAKAPAKKPTTAKAPAKKPTTAEPGTGERAKDEEES